MYDSWVADGAGRLAQRRTRSFAELPSVEKSRAQCRSGGAFLSKADHSLTRERMALDPVHVAARLVESVQPFTIVADEFAKDVVSVAVDSYLGEGGAETAFVRVE